MLTWWHKSVPIASGLSTNPSPWRTIRRSGSTKHSGQPKKIRWFSSSSDISGKSIACSRRSVSVNSKSSTTTAQVQQQLNNSSVFLCCGGAARPSGFRAVLRGDVVTVEATANSNFCGGGRTFLQKPQKYAATSSFSDCVKGG